MAGIANIKARTRTRRKAVSAARSEMPQRAEVTSKPTVAIDKAFRFKNTVSTNRGDDVRAKRAQTPESTSIGAKPRTERNKNGPLSKSRDKLKELKIVVMAVFYII